MIAIAHLIVMLAAAALPQSQRPAQAPGGARPPADMCGSVLDYQIWLDKRAFSPGEIDGRLGANASRALAAFQQANHLPVTGQPDCETWHVLAGDAPADTTVPYTITAADVEAALTPKIPSELPAQAQLPALNYRTVLERLAEKFHASPALLTSLNRGRRFAAGETITVPAVEPFDVSAKPPPAPDTGVSVEVARADSSLRVLNADGSLAFFAPVSSGSEHDPLPIGTWKVTGVGWMPVFHYNPELFWDAEATQTTATIKPGPNGPVGVVWIDINVPHYGLHGTPEPGHVGHTQSHGCVRLTNWDAARLASMVRPGTPVVFKE